MDILIAHPYKHHAFQFSAGCVKTGAEVCLATPLYRKGLGALISLLPGRMGAKASGYVCADLDVSKVYSPLRWQVERLRTISSPEAAFRSYFDNSVAQMLGSRKWNPKIVVTLQDYMPQTMRVARERGIKTVSDQIINQSNSAMHRIWRHCDSVGVPFLNAHDESINDEILRYADLVTAPSQYVRNDLIRRCKSERALEVIPYGVDTKMFDVAGERVGGNELVVAVRANTVRKGGHLFLKALKLVAQDLKCLAEGRSLKFISLGRVEPALQALVNDLNLPAGVTFEAHNFAYTEVPALLARASLFVMPSLSEGMSLAVCEAMQAGLPVLATPYIGVDIFKSGEMGLEVGDRIESVSEGLLACFRDMGSLSEWGRAGARAIGSNDWTLYQSRVADAISRI